MSVFMTTGVNKDNRECFPTSQVESKKTPINTVSKYNNPSYTEHLVCSDAIQFSLPYVDYKKPLQVSVVTNTILVITSI